MRSALRSLIVALLVLGVPAHGYAAAAMILCGMRHAQDHPATASAAPVAAPEAPCHGDGPLKNADAACDACAACAALSVPAIAEAPVAGVLMKASLLRVPFVAPGSTAHVPDGPERPPRTTSR
jgi:hypothetical protein